MRRANFLVFLVFFVFVSLSAGAQQLPDTCDSNFYKVLKERSWMGAKQEMEWNKAFIERGDATQNILVMSCFDKHMMDLDRIGAGATNRMFSDANKPGTLNYPDLFTSPKQITKLIRPNITKRTPPYDQYQATVSVGGPSVSSGNQFKTPPGADPPGGTFDIDNMERSLWVLVRDVLREYLEDQWALKPQPPRTSAICANMDQIWDYSRCRNLQGNSFWRFVPYPRNKYEYFENGDPRGAPCHMGGPRPMWINAIAAANPDPGTPGAMDPLAAIYEQYKPRGPGQPQRCRDISPHPTGLLVSINGSMEPDMVCPAAACWYDYKKQMCEN